MGYLTYDVEKESVRIPNKEVAQEYINAISTMAVSYTHLDVYKRQELIRASLYSKP